MASLLHHNVEMELEPVEKCTDEDKTRKNLIL